MRRFARKACVGLVLAASALVVTGGVAVAQASDVVESPEQVGLAAALDWAHVLAAVIGFATPYVVALLTKYQAQWWVKSAIAAATLASPAVIAYLTEMSGAKTWEGVIVTILTAMGVAGASRVTITGGSDTKLAIATENFGVGRAEPYGAPHAHDIATSDPAAWDEYVARTSDATLRDVKDLGL